MKRRDAINLNHEHILFYSFEVRDEPIEFIIAVETDQTIKGQMVLYVEMDHVYTEGKYKPGE